MPDPTLAAGTAPEETSLRVPRPRKGTLVLLGAGFGTWIATPKTDGSAELSG